MFRRHDLLSVDLLPLFSTHACHNNCVAGVPQPLARLVSAAPGVRQWRVFEAPIFTAIVARIPFDSAAFVEWLNEYELIVLKVIARGRTHWAHNPSHFRLSEQSNYSSSTPGRRSHMILGVSSNEIGKGYDNYGSEVGRLCSPLCILSRFTTMMYTGVAEGLISAGILVSNAARDLQPYRLHRAEWLASAPRPKPRCG